MTDKQLIRQEIERLINDRTDEKHVAEADITASKRSAYLDILNFIYSLPEEPTSEDLEEAAKSKYKLITIPPMPAEHAAYYNSAQVSRQEAFKAGAEWQKLKMKEALQTEYEKGQFDMREEMMEDAVEAEVMYPASSSTLQIRYKLPKNTKLKYGDKVKIIIVKGE